MPCSACRAIFPRGAQGTTMRTLGACMVPSDATHREAAVLTNTSPWIAIRPGIRFFLPAASQRPGAACEASVPLLGTPRRTADGGPQRLQLLTLVA